ncbi:M15 family metallopeptidase [Vagococcus hydrophili]|uniref:M15 family metallopeptidase n=1 Tax=Vagococcus hydrophili TaxID=2714947 RepID=A0A6G8AR40_9ENTE|nr:M15 family metallopeptidase [Vagococcus hydrophili]QIL47395.1 M15 family metallopeptidase [Vagococcus hydrophili]
MKKIKILMLMGLVSVAVSATTVSAQEATKNSEKETLELTETSSSSETKESFTTDSTKLSEQGVVTTETTETKDVKDKEENQKISVSYYGTIKKSGVTIWEDQDLTTVKGKTDEHLNKTFQITEEVKDEQQQNKAYLLIDNNQKRIGYVLSSAVEITENASGAPTKVDKYGTVLSSNYSLWKDVEQKEKIEDQQVLYKKTLSIKNEYHHFNGSTYYELYNNKNEFLGFINQEDITLSEHRGGSYISTWKYATVTKKNYSLWQDFSFSQERNNSSNFYQKTLLMKGEYHHFNGTVYYSVYDNQDNWLGYINQDGVTIGEHRGGIYIPSGKYVTLTKKDYAMWRNLDFSQEKNNSTKFYEQTMLAKGEYHHFNGSVYYSIYNNKNEWLGYLNKSGVKEGDSRGGGYLSLEKYGTVNRKGYSLWNNFSFSKEINNTSRYYEQTLLMKGKYNHYNGSTYYSVYDNKNRWLGYVNQDAVTLASGREGQAIKVNQTIAIPNNNYPMWQNFSWQKKNNTNNVAKKKYTVKYQYHHFNGDVYSSVYDNNKWMGYLNQKGSKSWQEKNGVLYIDNIMIANKKIKLPSYFNPGENGEAGRQVRYMISDMQRQGMSVSNSYSGFRTYQYQEQIYNDYVRINGQAKTDTFCARPGHSEHQTGLTFDLRHGNGTLIESGWEANWLSQNAHKYGFIIRYKASKTPITGYQGEPWHVRYVGKDQANKIMNSGQCLEEYLGVEGGNYR